MKKIIKIFLGSSIVELSKERLIIENFIRNVSDGFEEHYDVKLLPVLCENLDDAISNYRKQEEYNRLIRDCELCFFIFFTRVGEYTREEFDVAVKHFKEAGKPKVYTYFKAIGEGEGEKSLYDFMEELDKVLGHYYGTFSHIDTVKLRILLSLKFQEMDFVEIKTEGGKCVVDGKTVMSLDNVAEFANNEILSKLRSELEDVEKEYYALRPIYEKGGCDSAFYKKYSETATRRQSLIDEIDELQKLIFNVSMRMVSDDIHGEITTRQKEAYRLFELGDYDGCMSVLNSEDIDNDFLKNRQRIKDQETAVCKKYIKEHKTAIDILGSMKDYSARFEEIESRYEKIVPVISEMKIELDIAYDYVCYLYDQNKDEKTLSVAEQLLKLYEDDADKAMVLNIIALSYDNVNQPTKTEEYYLKAIGIREKLAEENPDRYSAGLATSYNNVGVFYKNQGQPEKAEEYYLKAIGIREKLAKENPDRYSAALADSYNNAGNFYKNQGQPEKAEEYYLKSIGIREKLAEENPDRYSADLAMSYNNAGVFYKNQGQPEKAEEYYLKAIGIYEKLAEENPDRYSAALATSYNNAGNFYADQRKATKAEEYCLKAIGIYEKLAEENPDRYSAALAISYYNYALMTKNDSMFEKALKLAKQYSDNYYCKKIIEILTQ